MSLEQQGEKSSRDAAGESPPSDAQQPTDASPLDDAELQERYRQEYLTQLRRLSCPGCGEDSSIF